MNKTTKVNGTEKRKIRYAVVGLGNIAQTAVLPGFNHAENSELHALVSSNDVKRQKLARKYGVKKTFSYEQYAECLESGIDAVYIALPNEMHKQFSIQAAAAGVHVLCEKPMAVNEHECQAMIEAAQRSNIKLMIAYRLHFEKANLSAIAIAQSGKLGDLRIFSSDFTQQVVDGNIRVTPTWKRGGGPTFDMGVYCINAARYLFGSEPTEVTAFGAGKDEARFRQSGEMTGAILRFPEERLAIFTCSFGAAPADRYSLIGTKGVLNVSSAYEYKESIQHELIIEGKTKKTVFPKRDQFAAELVYFSDCILHDKHPEPSGLEGLADVLIVQAIHESAKSGKAVPLQLLPKRQRPNLSQEISRPAARPPAPINAPSPSGKAA